MIELGCYRKLMWLPFENENLLIYKSNGCNRYIIHGHNFDLYFGFDTSLYVPELHKAGRIYKSYKYIKKYASKYHDVMMIFEPK